jgi:RNA polymerase sigma-70 factor (ECF subfamily)
MDTMAMPCFGSVPMAVDRRERPDATAQALETNMRRMFGLIYRIVGNVPDAQDLTQEAILKALRRKAQLKDDRKAVQWLNRIAVNTALDFVRRRRRVIFEELDKVLPDRAPPDKAESPEQRVLRSETRAWIEGGLRLLTERERTALLLRDFEELPAREVAQAMGCTTATVRSHIANARVKFRKYRREGQQR